MKMKTALTIAGSDPSGGAGIGADIKTMTMHGVYAMSVITALTAQNTTGVRAMQETTPEFLKQQIDAVFEDIFPDSVKIGMVSSSELICVIADRLKYHKAKNIVVDPVMVATSGSSLMKTDAVTTLTDVLLPIAALVTPNIPEGQILSGMTVKTKPAVIKKEKMMDFARDYDNIPLHTDEEYAKQTHFGRLVAPGVMTFMSVWAKYLEVDFFGTELLAGKSTKIEWIKPVYADDVLTGKAEVTNLVRRNAKNGLVEITIKAYNQNGELVLTDVTEAIVKCRPAE